MKIIWLGHGSFRIEIEDQVLLLDPWFTGNPSFPQDRRAEAEDGVTHVLITHGHGDHTTDGPGIAKAHGIPLVGIYDLMQHFEAEHGVQTIGFNKGGTVQLGKASVTMVNAVHSSSLSAAGPLSYAGAEAGFIIRGEDRVIYASGDTDVMADMEVIADRYKPDVGILSAGGHFTMDMEGAAYAAKRFFDFKVVIPCHFGTFPILEQSTDALVAGLPGVEVITPEVMNAIAL